MGVCVVSVRKQICMYYGTLVHTSYCIQHTALHTPHTHHTHPLNKHPTLPATQTGCQNRGISPTHWHHYTASPTNSTTAACAPTRPQCSHVVSHRYPWGGARGYWKHLLGTGCPLLWVCCGWGVRWGGEVGVMMYGCWCVCVCICGYVSMHMSIPPTDSYLYHSHIPHTPTHPPPTHTTHTSGFPVPPHPGHPGTSTLEQSVTFLYPSVKQVSLLFDRRPGVWRAIATRNRLKHPLPPVGGRSA